MTKMENKNHINYHFVIGDKIVTNKDGEWYKAGEKGIITRISLDEPGVTKMKLINLVHFERGDDIWCPSSDIEIDNSK